MSPRPYTNGYSIERDVEDLDAVLTASGARLLYGLSSGGVIALHAARLLPQVRKLAVSSTNRPALWTGAAERTGTL